MPFARAGFSRIQSTLQRATVSSLPVRHARTFASVLPAVPAAPKSTSAPRTKLPSNAKDVRQPGASRPHLGIEVDPKHGLYAFFRKKVEDGVAKYETVEPIDVAADKSGRAWTAAELRRKSFQDLHTLWYVLVRERNLLATQREEARRQGISHNRMSSATKVFRVRKSMARIKYVLNERRLAYEGAMEIVQDKAKRPLLRREVKRQAHKKSIARTTSQKDATETAQEDLKATLNPSGEVASLQSAQAASAAPSA
ncbi:MRP-L47-domain-containing protein [Trametopsis cervina]|nr:MRP-L47-domain-containing protein [Trametopsis cervina]